MLTPCRQQILSGIPACEREFAHQAFGVKGKLYFKFPAAAQTFAQPPYWFVCRFCMRHCHQEKEHGDGRQGYPEKIFPHYILASFVSSLFCIFPTTGWQKLKTPPDHQVGPDPSHNPRRHMCFHPPETWSLPVRHIFCRLRT